MKKIIINIVIIIMILSISKIKINGEELKKNGDEKGQPGSAKSFFAGWLYKYTPPIEGKVIDATTGEPVEKAVVQSFCEKIVFNPLALGGSGRSLCGGRTVITDKEGKYRIPGRLTIHILSNYRGMMIQVIHPLYESGHGGLSWQYDKTKDKYDWIYSGEKQAGTIHYDIKLLGIEEAIRRGAEEYERTKSIWAGFNLGGFIGSYSGSFFKEHWDKKFVEDILKKWEEIIISKELRNTSVDDQFKRVKKQVEEAYKGEK